MAIHLEFARRAARLRALLLVALATAFGACDATDKLTTVSDDPASADPVAPTEVSFASTFRGGIPIGTYAQPTHEFGNRYNGALRNIWPEYLRRELAAIKARGGKVVLMFAGNERHYKDRQGHFDFSKWKARVNRFRNVDFSSYVRDGTIVGHYLIDEPYDPFNWHGRPVPGSTIEAMAKYSKQLWPSLPTIVRAEPDQVKWSGRYRYLDAAWAQYTYRKGNVGDYIRKHVSQAQKMGLALVVGLNITKGSPSKGWMTPSQIESWGGTLLSSSYPCAFISWQYNSSRLSSSSMRSAMDKLRRRAENRGTRSCRSS